MENVQSFSFSDSQCTKFVPIMLELCLMLLHTYYAQNYAGIIIALHYNNFMLYYIIILQAAFIYLFSVL